MLPTTPRPVPNSTVTVERLNREHVAGRVIQVEVWGGRVEPRWAAVIRTAEGKLTVGTVVEEV